MHVLRAVVAIAVLAGAASVVGTAAAARGGVIRIWVTPSNGTVSRIVVTGAIGDYGTATSISRAGKADIEGNYVRVALTRGGFEVNSTAFDAAINGAPPTALDKQTCSVYFTDSGHVTLFGGRGAYAGIAGTLEVTETFAAIGPRYRSGATKGRCNLSAAAAPVAQWGAITGVGSVRFG